MKYRNNSNGKVAIIINGKAAGMCDKTIGLTLVIYKYEDENYGYPFVMEHKEFYSKHSQVTEG